MHRRLLFTAAGSGWDAVRHVVLTHHHGDHAGGLAEVAPDPRYTADRTLAAASARKPATLDVRTILPGHGDPLTTGAAEALRTLAAAT